MGYKLPVAGLLLSLSTTLGAELKPLDDEALAAVSGQGGIVVDVASRIQAQSIQYNQHTDTGEVRGSISFNNLDVFSPGLRVPGDSSEGVFAIDEAFGTPDERAEVQSRRGAALFGVSLAVDGLAGLFSGFDLPIDLTDRLTGERLSTATFELDVVERNNASALRIKLPQLTKVRNAAFDSLNDFDNPAIATILTEAIDVATTINLLAEFDLSLSEQLVGRFRLAQITDLDSVLYIQGGEGGSSGLRVDLDLGVGIGSLSYLDLDADGGEVSLNGVRIGQVTARPDNELGARRFFSRPTLGAPLLGLSLDVETRELIDLTTGLSRETSLLKIGLPDIQNLDLTIDNIRIGEGNVGGLDILDINTLIDNATVQQLNQTFGYNFALGNGSGVDALGQAANGYQLNGELLLSGTAGNSLQFNGQWGGQIGSINYYDNTGGTEGRVGLNEISVYGQGQNEQGDAILTPAQFSGTLTLNEQGVELGNLNAQGSIAIQSVTVGQTNLGAFLIDNFQLRNSYITISGK